MFVQDGDEDCFPRCPRLPGRLRQLASPRRYTCTIPSRPLDFENGIGNAHPPTVASPTNEDNTECNENYDPQWRVNLNTSKNASSCLARSRIIVFVTFTSYVPVEESERKLLNVSVPDSMSNRTGLGVIIDTISLVVSMV
eukprot:m.176750 g.176750  ORF g.176750 m.176750 type:complete len:140 (+) comp39145_c1_seq1:243-662(+)